MTQRQELNSNSFRVLQESIDVKKLLVVIPLLFLIQPAFGEIIVQNDQTYVGNDGMLHIVGEIQNNSKAPLNPPIEGAFFLRFSTKAFPASISTPELL